MNVKKLNQMFLNYIITDKRVFMEELDDEIILTDSYAIYFINKGDFHLNKDDFKEYQLKEKFIGKIEETYETTFVDSGIVKDKKYMLFRSEDGTLEKEVNKNFLSCIDLKNCTFKSGTESRDLLLVYKFNKLIAAILPIVKY